MQGVGSAALAIVTEPLIAALLTFAATGMMLYATRCSSARWGR